MEWMLKHAQEHFEEVVEAAKVAEPQLIAIRGRVEFAVISMAAFRKLTNDEATVPISRPDSKTRALQRRTTQ